MRQTQMSMPLKLIPPAWYSMILCHTCLPGTLILNPGPTTRTPTLYIKNASIWSTIASGSSNPLYTRCYNALYKHWSQVSWQIIYSWVLKKLVRPTIDLRWELASNQHISSKCTIKPVIVSGYVCAWFFCRCGQFILNDLIRNFIHLSTHRRTLLFEEQMFPIQPD